MPRITKQIERLKVLRAELESPVRFYAEHVERWRVLAEATVRQVLINLRPVGVENERWVRQVELAAVRVAADLLGEDEAGVIISLGTTSVADPFYEIALSTGSGSPMGVLRLDQIERWVAAGRAGEPDGKRLDGRDALLSDEKIARNVLFAMRLGKKGAAGLRAAILEFIGGEIADDAERLYPEILKTWVDVFSVRCVADWRAWVGREVKGFKV